MILNVITSLFVTSMMYSQVQGCTTDDNPYAIQQRSAIEQEHLIGPDGVTKCVVTERDATNARYYHCDKNGECCWCTFCQLGQHLKSYCECEKDQDEPKEITICVGVTAGHFMDQSNFCLVPYNCTASCPEKQTLVRNCSAYADIQCRCKEGRYNPNKKDTGNIPQSCLLKPSCLNLGEQPLPNDGTDDEDTRTFSCKVCRDGFFKKEGDGECKPHRDCQTKAGNQMQDNECLNDDLPSVFESPGNTASPPTQDPAIEATTEATTESTSPTCTTAVPMSVDHKNTDIGVLSCAIIGWVCFVVALCIIIWLYKDRKSLQKELNEQKVRRPPLLPGGAPPYNTEENNGL